MVNLLSQPVSAETYLTRALISFNSGVRAADLKVGQPILCEF